MQGPVVALKIKLLSLSISDRSNVVLMAEESERHRADDGKTSCSPAQSLPTRRNKTMQYLLLIYDDEKRWTQGYADAELGEYRAFGKEFAQAIKGGHALQPTSAAATVRVRDGKRLTTDGPFAETKEQLRGYYLVEARDR